MRYEVRLLTSGRYSVWDTNREQELDNYHEEKNAIENADRANRRAALYTIPNFDEETDIEFE